MLMFVCLLFLSFHALTTARGNDKTNKRDLRDKQAEKHEGRNTSG